MAIPDPPLACDEEDNPSAQERLLIHRSELRIAQQYGTYRDRKVSDFSIPRTQTPFLRIALLRALDGVEYPDRVQWMADFNAIQTGIDAALFMTEAKLKVQHVLDMKKVTREAQQKIRRTKQTVKW